MKLEIIKLTLNDKLNIDGKTSSIAYWIAQDPTMLSSFIRTNREKYKLALHAELELKAKLKSIA